MVNFLYIRLHAANWYVGVKPWMSTQCIVLVWRLSGDSQTYVLHPKKMQKVTSRNSLSHMDKSRNESSSRLANGSDTNSLNIQPTMDVNDWRRAISTPTKYRVGSASFHMRPRDLFQVIVVFLLIVTIVTLIYRGNSQPMSPVHVNHAFIPSKQYNRDYPLTPEISILHGRKLRIAIISDLDQASKVEGEKGTVWKSFFKKGYLTIFNNNTMTVSWDEKDTVLHSSMAQGNYTVSFPCWMGGGIGWKTGWRMVVGKCR